MTVLRMLMALSLLLPLRAVAAEDPRPNVLLITVDTFRPDHLGCYGYDRETSPALDALAAEGVLFLNTISSSSWTTPGLLSVLTGLWAPTHGVDVRGKSLPRGTPTIASALREAGYATPDILYLSSIPNMQNLGLTDSYADRDRHLPSGDKVLFKALEAYADSTFFLYYHYRNLHLPYNPAPPYDRMYTPAGFDRSGFVKDRIESVRSNVTIPVGTVRFTPSDSAWVRGLYDGQIREMDDNFFTPLVAHLKDLGLYEKTLIVVTADHGEELMEHGFIGHPSTSFKANVFDEAIRIPLVMTHPQLLSPTIVDQQVRNVDILPTVLDLLGLSIPEGVQGKSLMPTVRGRRLDSDTAYVETTPGGYQATEEMLKTRVRAVRTDRWKLIHTGGPGVDRTELYDLLNDADETRDVAEAYPDTVAGLVRALHRWVLVAGSASAGSSTDGSPAVRVEEQVRVLFPADGDTIRYDQVQHAIHPEWTGPEQADYVVEYQVGEGSYHLEGRMPVAGTSSRYGPYTEEMWNMLALYNPFTFRVVAKGQPDTASDWVTFHVQATSDDPPGLTVLIRAGMAFVWAEGGLLAGGLAGGGIQLLWTISRIPPDQIISAVLLLAIVAALSRPLLLRMGRVRLERWGAVAAYTLFIYLTLPMMPVMWRWLWSATQGRIDYIGTIVVLWAGAALLAFLLIRRRRLFPMLAAPPVAATYGWLLMSLGTSPAERLHLAEYGLLSLLTFRALQVDLPRGQAYFLGWIIAASLGAVDEAIQWVLPGRVFEWKDVGLNVLSSGLAMVVIAILSYPERAGDARRPV